MTAKPILIAMYRNWYEGKKNDTIEEIASMLGYEFLNTDCQMNQRQPYTVVRFQGGDNPELPIEPGRRAHEVFTNRIANMMGKAIREPVSLYLILDPSSILDLKPHLEAKQGCETKIETTPVGRRAPTEQEYRDGADVVFVRKDAFGLTHNVYACLPRTDSGIAVETWAQHRSVMEAASADVDEWVREQTERFIDREV